MNTPTSIASPQVYVSSVSADVGLGVFASRAFAVGELVELAPMLVLEQDYSQLPIEIRDRVYNWGYLTDTNAGSALALGYGSLYNHSDSPNLRYVADDQHKCMHYVARRAISAGEQLTIHYDQADGEHKAIERDWFSHHDIEQADIDGRSDD